MDPWLRLGVLATCAVGTFLASLCAYGRTLMIEARMKELRNHGPLVAAARARAAFPDASAPEGGSDAAAAPTGPAASASGAASAATTTERAALSARLDALEREAGAIEAMLGECWDRALKRAATAGGPLERRLAAVEAQLAGPAAPGSDEIARSIAEGRVAVYRRYVEGQLGYLGAVWKERLELASPQAAELDRIVAALVEETVARAGQRQLTDTPWNGWNDEEADLTRAAAERLRPGLTVEQQRRLEELAKTPPRRLPTASSAEDPR